MASRVANVSDDSGEDEPLEPTSMDLSERVKLRARNAARQPHQSANSPFNSSSSTSFIPPIHNTPTSQVKRKRTTSRNSASSSTPNKKNLDRSSSIDSSSVRSTSKGKGKQNLQTQLSTNSSSSPRKKAYRVREHGTEDDSDGSMASWTKQDGERWQDYWLDPEQDRDGEFEVGEILRWRYHPRNGKIQYRTTWVGYSLYCAEWLYESKFDGTDVIKEFWKARGGRPKDYKRSLSSGEALDSSDTDQAAYIYPIKRAKAARKKIRHEIRRDKKIIETRKTNEKNKKRKGQAAPNSDFVDDGIPSSDYLSENQEKENVRRGGNERGTGKVRSSSRISKGSLRSDSEVGMTKRVTPAPATSRRKKLQKVSQNTSRGVECSDSDEESEVAAPIEQAKEKIALPSVSPEPQEQPQPQQQQQQQQQQQLKALVSYSSSPVKTPPRPKKPEWRGAHRKTTKVAEILHSPQAKSDLNPSKLKVSKSTSVPTTREADLSPSPSVESEPESITEISPPPITKIKITSPPPPLPPRPKLTLADRLGINELAMSYILDQRNVHFIIGPTKPTSKRESIDSLLEFHEAPPATLEMIKRGSSSRKTVIWIDYQTRFILEDGMKEGDGNPSQLFYEKRKVIDYFFHTLKSRSNVDFFLYGNFPAEPNDSFDALPIFPNQGGGIVTLTLSSLFYYGLHSNEKFSKAVESFYRCDYSNQRYDLWNLSRELPNGWELVIHPWILSFLEKILKNGRLPNIYHFLNMIHSSIKTLPKGLIDEFGDLLKPSGTGFFRKLDWDETHSQSSIPNDGFEDIGTRHSEDWIKLFEALDEEVLATMHKLQRLTMREKRFHIILDSRGAFLRDGEKRNELGGISIMKLGGLRSFLDGL